MRHGLRACRIDYVDGNALSRVPLFTALTERIVRVQSSPARRLLMAVLIATASGAGAAWFAMAQPHVPDAMRVHRVATAQDTIVLVPTDLIEEPDFLDTWVELDAFFARQQRIATLLRRADVAVARCDAEGSACEWRALTGATRPLSSLPFVFWFQLMVGSIATVVGAWIWAMRPQDAATRAFAVTGIGVMLSSHAAAIYSAREVALPGLPFRLISAVNHLGAPIFGIALCSLLLVYPRPLAARRWIPALALIATLWWLSDIFRIAPDPNWGTRLPLVLEMLGAVVLSVVQWRRAAFVPTERAVLRWFGMCLLVGPGLFIGMLVVAAVLDNVPPISQAYGMGFFLLTYLGMAFGMRRYRLFALDAWALRVLFWAALCALFVTLDLLLLRFAGAASARSLFVVTMLALATLPVRQWVWRHVLHRPKLDIEQTVDRALGVSYATTVEERALRWQAYVQELFEPLTLTVDDASSATHARLLDDGAGLSAPAVAGAPPLRLVYAGGGRRLFDPSDVRLLDRLVSLLRQADASRATYEAGVMRERQRIARDLHDTVSSPLLSGLAQSRAAEDTSDAGRRAAVGEEITRALAAMRDVVRDSGEPAPMNAVLADARFECVTRLEDAGIAVDWPIVAVGERMMTARERIALGAFLREATSNVLRHAQASRVTVSFTPSADGTSPSRLTFRDDGRGLPAVQVPDRQGLANLRIRAEELGGRCWVEAPTNGAGTEVRLELPAALFGAGG